MAYTSKQNEDIDEILYDRKWENINNLGRRSEHPQTFLYSWYPMKPNLSALLVSVTFPCRPNSSPSIIADIIPTGLCRHSEHTISNTAREVTNHQYRVEFEPDRAVE